jgi:hypothetical protein
MSTSLYETDFYRWTFEQSKLLALGNLDGLDLENLAEEIASLGRQERQELENRLGVLIGHLLKWQYQPNKRSRSWQVTISNQRRAIKKLLTNNPSLKPYLDTAVQDGFLLGLGLVLSETKLKKKLLPTDCPYEIAQIFDVNFPDGIQTYFD